MKTLKAVRNVISFGVFFFKAYYIYLFLFISFFILLFFMLSALMLSVLLSQEKSQIYFFFLTLLAAEFRSVIMLEMVNYFGLMWGSESEIL